LFTDESRAGVSLDKDSSVIKFMSNMSTHLTTAFMLDEPPSAVAQHSRIKETNSLTRVSNM